MNALWDLLREQRREVAAWPVWQQIYIAWSADGLVAKQPGHPPDRSHHVLKFSSSQNVGDVHIWTDPCGRPDEFSTAGIGASFLAKHPGHHAAIHQVAALAAVEEVLRTHPPRVEYMPQWVRLEPLLRPGALR